MSMIKTCKFRALRHLPFAVFSVYLVLGANVGHAQFLRERGRVPLVSARLQTLQLFDRFERLMSEFDQPKLNVGKTAPGQFGVAEKNDRNSVDSMRRALTQLQANIAVGPRPGKLLHLAEIGILLNAQKATSSAERHRLLRSLPVEVRSTTALGLSGAVQVLREFRYRGVLRVRTLAERVAQPSGFQSGNSYSLPDLEDGAPPLMWQSQVSERVDCEDVSPDNEVYQGECATEQEAEDFIIEMMSAHAEFEDASAIFESETEWYCNNKVDFDLCGESVASEMSFGDRAQFFESESSVGVNPSPLDGETKVREVSGSPPSCSQLANAATVGLGAGLGGWYGGQWLLGKAGTHVVTRIAIGVVLGSSAFLMVVGAVAVTAAVYCYMNQ